MALVLYLHAPLWAAGRQVERVLCLSCCKKCPSSWQLWRYHISENDEGSNKTESTTAVPVKTADATDVWTLAGTSTADSWGDDSWGNDAFGDDDADDLDTLLALRDHKKTSLSSSTRSQTTSTVVTPSQFTSLSDSESKAISRYLVFNSEPAGKSGRKWTSKGQRSKPDDGSDLPAIGESKEWAGEQYEKTGDSSFSYFQKILERSPKQCLRYGGSPLWIQNHKEQELLIRNVSPCNRCGAPRVFETQALPTLLPHLEELGLFAPEFGVIVCFTCRDSCENIPSVNKSSSLLSKQMQEVVILQDAL